jgi:hypothetical protein
MPLPRPVARTLNHNRIIDCRGYQRDDGLWDIEGHLTDVKAINWFDRTGSPDLPAGVPAHDMWIRLTIDLDMNIHECVAATDSSPYRLCSDITAKFAQLKGMRITRGWTRALKDVIGGSHGCTHQWELLGRIAATAYQSTNIVRQKTRGHKTDGVPRTFNTCHMYTAGTDETLRRWPELYTGSKKREELPKVS